MEKFKDMIGARVGRLTVIKRVENGKHGDAMWLCLCECGNNVVVRGGDLRRTKGTRSCGCLAREESSKRKKTHGMSKSRIYKIRQRMIDRCENEKHVHFKDYGGRGIKVCEEWRNDFQTFYDWAIANGYADNLTIDRINVNGNYEPSNCRWIAIEEQGGNRRNNKLVTINGETKNVTEWCKELGLNRATVYKRLCNGWSIQNAFAKTK